MQRNKNCHAANQRHKGASDHTSVFSDPAGTAFEVLIGEADSDRALADRGGYSFDRAAADVAGREHSRQTGFEQVGIAAELFPGGRGAGLPAEIRASDDESVAIEFD